MGIRYLLHIVLMGGLDPHDLEEILWGSHRNRTRAKIFEAVAFRALDKAVEVMDDREKFEKFGTAMLTAFIKNFDTTEGRCSSKIIALLWNNRDSFLVLSSRGLLPGCALLLIICTMWSSYISDPNR